MLKDAAPFLIAVAISCGFAVWWFYGPEAAAPSSRGAGWDSGLTMSGGEDVPDHDTISSSSPRIWPSAKKPRSRRAPEPKASDARELRPLFAEMAEAEFKRKIAMLDANISRAKAVLKALRRNTARQLADCRRGKESEEEARKVIAALRKSLQAYDRKIPEQEEAAGQGGLEALKRRIEVLEREYLKLSEHQTRQAEAHLARLQQERKDLVQQFRGLQDKVQSTDNR